jgi:hypothetical protein
LSKATTTQPFPSASITATGASAGDMQKSVWKIWPKKGKAKQQPQTRGEDKRPETEFVVNADSQPPAQEKPNALFWPKEMLPAVVPETRIYTWGYDVDINHVFSSASQATVFQHAMSLLSDLDNARTSDDDVKSRIFISSIESSDKSHD